MSDKMPSRLKEALTFSIILIIFLWDWECCRETVRKLIKNMIVRLMEGSWELAGLHLLLNTVEPLYNGHLGEYRERRKWPLKTREVLNMSQCVDFLFTGTKKSGHCIYLAGGPDAGVNLPPNVDTKTAPSQWGWIGPPKRYHSGLTRFGPIFVMNLTEWITFVFSGMDLVFDLRQKEFWVKIRLWNGVRKTRVGFYLFLKECCWG